MALISTHIHEPGTFRTAAGTLVHSRERADGSFVIEREDGAPQDRAPEELIKLSDDPNWPDIAPSIASPFLFED